MKKLGLCGGETDRKQGTNTEDYPDSDKVTDEECNDDHAAAAVGALEYVIQHELNA